MVSALPSGVFFLRIVVLLAALVAIGSNEAFADGDAARGGGIFRATCGVCHPARKDTSRNDANTRIGPNLFGVIGRHSGMVPGFRYSTAMKTSGIVWTHEVLQRYIHAPQQVVPNIRMSFKGLPDQKDVNDVIAYLDTLK